MGRGTLSYSLKKELLLLQRDKPALLYALLMPVVLLLIVVSLNAISFTATVVVIDQDGGPASRELIDVLRATPNIKFLDPKDRLMAMAQLTIPEGFSDSVERTGIGELRVDFDSSRKLQAEGALFEIRKAIFSYYAGVYKERGISPDSLGGSQLVGALISPILDEKVKPETIMSSIMETLKVTENPIYEIRGRQMGLLPFGLPPIIAGIMTLFALVLAPYSIIHERKVGLYERLATLPIRRRDMLLSKIIIITAVIFLQAILLFLVLTNYYGFFVGGALTILAAGILGFATAALSILLAVTAKTILQMFQLIGVVLVLEVMISSGVDTEIIGGLGGQLVGALPIMQGRLMLEQTILKGGSIAAPALYLALFGIAALFIAGLLFTKIRPSR